ncbi:PD-(D/E)XK nuclease family protein [Winogradskyella sp. A3E31]|uniref:PD-(D/E)XK nuclease family protein n=1 Tax=Winogradskyella sp. A3E31 TaxID=3349637 RepID=UPI00398AA547
MVTFIEDVLNDLDKKSHKLHQILFILPSRRAGTFLKYQIASRSKSTFFSPRILSIEDFVSELSNLTPLNNSEALFRFYSVYKGLTDKDQLESFEAFSKWGQIVLQDFNEIDRFLIKEEHIFDYLKAIQEIKHWSVEPNQTEFTKRYLSFWNKLKQYYSEYGSTLKDDGVGYQGLIYKEAVNNLEPYMNSSHLHHVFLGFNALNRAEEQIIQGLLQNDLADIYWDIDVSFIKNTIHDAGHFLRDYKSKWPYFQKNKFNWETKQYQNEKYIEVLGCPKQIGQAKYAGQLLSKLISEKTHNFESTALVLGDESLLTPILNSLPKEVSAANVTMGLPLSSIPLASFFNKLFSVHKKSPLKFYYKDVLELLGHPMLQFLISFEALKTHIQSHNIVYISSEELKSIAPQYKSLLTLLFGSWDNDTSKSIENSIALIYKIKESLNAKEQNARLELEYLYRFYRLFNELSSINSKYPFLDSISALQSVYKELLDTEKLDFKGEPLKGLQIMGMLESRVLDFETVIITSVNEGILPAGKSNNSFIPFDVKKENGLPTYKEKDAVYTYHFYHLLQRAKNIYILYNTEVDALNSGEKSRFITQLEVEGLHKIHHKIASPSIPVIEHNPIAINKNDDIIKTLKVVAQKGFSPSSLTSYIRNPIDFYHKKVLGIKDTEDVEETVAANTLGSVIHNTLEDLYKPLVNTFLSVEDLLKMKGQINDLVSLHFNDIYKSDAIKQGKNLIIFEIAKRYVSNFIETELAQIKNGNRIKLLAVELDAKIEVPIKELNFSVNLTGKVDRVDEYNGVTRIIDYKSGKVERRHLEIYDWREIIRDYDAYSKAFQVLCYAYIMFKDGTISLPVEAGIISFKNLQSGFLKFAEKEASNSRSKNSDITSDTLTAFEEQLKSLILEICDPQVAFVEKEIK